MDLGDIVALRAEDASLLRVLGLWLFSFTVSSALLRPQAFLRGLDPDFIPDRTRAYAWFYHRLSSAAVFGGAAWLGIRRAGNTGADHGFTWNHFDQTVVFLVLFAVVSAPLIFGWSRQSEFRHHHPELRIRRWTGRMISNNRTTWLVWAGGYESLVRGYCLFALAEIAGPGPAIAMVAALEVGLRTHRPSFEVLATVPMSLAFSIGALWTGSIAGPWLAHSATILAAESLGRSANGVVAPTE